MSIWEKYMQSLNHDYGVNGDEDSIAYANWYKNELQLIHDEYGDEDSEEKQNALKDLKDKDEYYKGNAYKVYSEDDSIRNDYDDYDDFINDYSDIDYQGRKDALELNKDFWLEDMQKEHPDNFRRAQWNKNKDSIYWYDKDGNKHRASTHASNTANGAQVYEWQVDNRDELPSKVEDIVVNHLVSGESKLRSLQSQEKGKYATHASNLSATDAHIIPYSEVGKYEDSFDGDEEREEDKRNSDELTKRDIKTFK